MDKEKVLDYLTYTPNNTNWAVLKGMVGDSEELRKYVTETPYNMNRAVVEGILDRIDDDGDTPPDYGENVLFEGELTTHQETSNKWGTGNFSSLAAEININDGDTVIITLSDKKNIYFLVSVNEGTVTGHATLPKEAEYNFVDNRYGNEQYGPLEIYVNGTNTGAFTIVQIFVVRGNNEPIKLKPRS